MCGRFTLTKPAEQIRDLFDVKELPRLEPRYNIAPTQDVLVIREKEQQRFGHLVRWGLVPFWAKDLSFGARCINARSETVAEKPAFRAAYKKRRCLIPTDGFYEWKKVSGQKRKTPFYITLNGHELGAFAGIWERWHPKDGGGKPLDTCSILTTAPNSLVAGLHDRMPVFLDEADWQTWLSPETSPGALEELLHAMPSSRFEVTEVSREVSNARNEGEHLIAPVRAE